MKIINQNSFNECGICVANMLINYYGYHEVNKQELLNRCSLSKEGLSLLELEQLCSKYGIELDSYQLDWKELFEINNTRPFITIFEHQGMLHYVVGIIKNKTMFVYDPTNKVYQFQVNNPPSNWLGIVSFSKYKKIQIKPIDVKQSNIFKTFSNISWIFIFSEVMEFIISILLSLFMSKIMNLNQSNVMTSSIWKISFIFVSLLIINEVFNLLNFFIKNWYFKKIFKTTIGEYFLLFRQKNYYFYENYSKFQIIQLLGLLNKVIHFHCFFLSDFFSELILAIASLLLICFVNKTMLFLILISFLGLIFIYSLQLNVNKNLIRKTFKTQINLQENINNFLEYKQNNINKSWENNWVNQIIFQIDSLYKTNLFFNFKKEFIKLGLNFINQLSIFCIILILWSDSNFMIGNMFIIVSLFNTFNKSINNCLATITNFWTIKPIIKMLNELYANNNIQTNNGLLISEINSISFNNNKFHNNIAIQISDITDNKFVSSLLNATPKLNFSVKINELDLSNYSRKQLFESVILVNGLNKDYYNDWKNLIPKNNLLTKDILNYITSKFKNEIQKLKFNELNQEFKCLLMLINLMNEDSKIICLNNLIDNISLEHFDFVQRIFTYINKHNFIISNVRNDAWLVIYENLI